MCYVNIIRIMSFWLNGPHDVLGGEKKKEERKEERWEARKQSSEQESLHFHLSSFLSRLLYFFRDRVKKKRNVNVSISRTITSFPSQFFFLHYFLTIYFTSFCAYYLSPVPDTFNDGSEGLRVRVIPVSFRFFAKKSIFVSILY